MEIRVGYSLAIIFIVALVTLGTRALPFLLWGRDQRTPGAVLYLGRVLPGAIMAMLIVYCVRHIRPGIYPFGLPELLGIAAVVILHLWKRNTLISILFGTMIYMVLVQKIFV